MLVAESSPMADEVLDGMGGGGDFNSYGGMIRSGVLQSLSMTVLSELGDKTFFIAAVMAMRYSRVKVLVGAMLAMVTMTVLSAGMGAVAETMISKLWTQRLATVLFLSFGVHMLYDALKDELMALPRILKTKAGDAGSAAGGADESRQSVMASELAEVEAELDSKFKKDGKTETKKGRGMQFVVSRLRQLDPVILEAFMMTFVAEWGDRSQIATIGLAAANDIIGVTIGGIIGHSICTGIAVVGGRHIARYVSERTLGVTGGALFILFGLQSMLL